MLMFKKTFWKYHKKGGTAPLLNPPMKIDDDISYVVSANLL